MNTKRRLLEMLCDLAGEIDALRMDLDELEREVRKPKPIKRGENVDGVKRGRGRPKGSKNKK